MDWQRNLEAAIKKNECSKSELARKTGIKEPTLRNWVRKTNRRGVPPISSAIKIAEAMGMTLDEVFRGRVPTPPERLAQMLRQVLSWAQAEEEAAADHEHEDSLFSEQATARRKRAKKRKGA